MTMGRGPSAYARRSRRNVQAERSLMDAGASQGGPVLRNSARPKRCLCGKRSSSRC